MLVFKIDIFCSTRHDCFKKIYQIPPELLNSRAQVWRSARVRGPVGILRSAGIIFSKYSHSLFTLPSSPTSHDSSLSNPLQLNSYLSKNSLKSLILPLKNLISSLTNFHPHQLSSINFNFFLFKNPISTISHNSLSTQNFYHNSHIHPLSLKLFFSQILPKTSFPISLIKNSKTNKQKLHFFPPTTPSYRIFIF